MEVSADSAVIVGLDVMEPDPQAGSTSIPIRRHFLYSGSEFFSGDLSKCRQISPETVFSAENAPLFEKLSSPVHSNRVYFFLYPTMTYSGGASANLFADVAPEDRALIRKVRRRFPDRMEYFKVPLSRAGIFDKIPGYLADDEARARFRKQQVTSSLPAAAQEEERPRFPVGFDPSVPCNIGSILRSCLTRPNRQDLFYVVTKSLGINLAIKITFATINVLNGSLPFLRAVCSTLWYQSQDVFFTLFGQTYMKFLGKMSRMLRVGRGYYGDLLFCFFQFTCFEILNRSILGPLGENPLAYSWAGIALILRNNLQGMISGGPTTPAILRVRRAGAISHKTMMHIYQLCGLTFHFGTFAAFGYQKIYTALTTTQMVCAWGTFILFSLCFKDPRFSTAESDETLERLNAIVRSRARGVAVPARRPDSSGVIEPDLSGACPSEQA